MQIFVIRNYKERCPELKGKALTDRLIIDLLGEDAKVVRSDSGKPSIRWEQTEQPPFVSVSHSGDVFACVFDDDNIGIDIQINKQMDYERVSRRYYTATEQECVGQDDPDSFFVIWTRKEAFAKYTGAGLKQIAGGESVIGREDVMFKDIIPLEGYHMCICSSAGNNKEEDYEIQFFD